MLEVVDHIIDLAGSQIYILLDVGIGSQHVFSHLGVQHRHGLAHKFADIPAGFLDLVGVFLDEYANIAFEDNVHLFADIAFVAEELSAFELFEVTAFEDFVDEDGVQSVRRDGRWQHAWTGFQFFLVCSEEYWVEEFEDHGVDHHGFAKLVSCLDIRT